MVNKSEREKIIALINREVVPAIGCTEPVAVALCVAKATEILGAVPAKIEVALSGNMLKNAMGVGIPGTGMIGLPIAMALGALVGKSSYGLEVLRDVNDEAVKRGCKFIDEGRISISHAADAPSNLHIDVVVRAENGDSARAVISCEHTVYQIDCRNHRTFFHLRESFGESSHLRTITGAPGPNTIGGVFTFSYTFQVQRMILQQFL